MLLLTKVIVIKVFTPVRFKTATHTKLHKPFIYIYICMYIYTHTYSEVDTGLNVS